MRTPAAGADRDRAAGGRAGLGTRRSAGITVLAALLLMLIGVAPSPRPAPARRSDRRTGSRRTAGR